MPDFLSMLRAFAEGFAIKAFFKMLPANDNNVRYYYTRVFLSILSHYRFHMSNSKHRTSVQKQICTQVNAAWNIRWQPGCPHFLLVDSHRCHIVPHHMIPIWYPYGDGSKPWYLVNLKIAGKWMFIPLRMVLIGIDPYPYPIIFNHQVQYCWVSRPLSHKTWEEVLLSRFWWFCELRSKTVDTNVTLW